MKKVTFDVIQKALDDAGCRRPFPSLEHAFISVGSAIHDVLLTGLINEYDIMHDSANWNVMDLCVRESFKSEFERFKVSLIIDPEIHAVWEVMES